MLVVAGLGFRIASVPFHFYAPDVFQGTTMPAAALLAVVPKIAGFVALLRLVWSVLLTNQLHPDFAALGDVRRGRAGRAGLLDDDRGQRAGPTANRVSAACWRIPAWPTPVTCWSAWPCPAAIRCPTALKRCCSTCWSTRS